MKTIKCAPQKAGRLIIGISGIVTAMVLFVLGITLVPVLGIILSMPTFAISLYILKLHLNNRCEFEHG